MILAGRDVVEILKKSGHDTAADVGGIAAWRPAGRRISALVWCLLTRHRIRLSVGLTCIDDLSRPPCNWLASRGLEDGQDSTGLPTHDLCWRLGVPCPRSQVAKESDGGSRPDLARS